MGWHLSFPPCSNCGSLSKGVEQGGLELVTCNICHAERYPHLRAEVVAQRGVVIDRFDCPEPVFFLLSPTTPLPALTQGPWLGSRLLDSFCHPPPHRLSVTVHGPCMMGDWVAPSSTRFCWFSKLTGAAGPGELGAGKLNRTPWSSPSSCSDRPLSAMARGQPRTLLSPIRGLHTGGILTGPWRGRRGFPGASMAGWSSEVDVHTSPSLLKGKELAPCPPGEASLAFWLPLLNTSLSDCPSSPHPPTLPTHPGSRPWISGHVLCLGDHTRLLDVALPALAFPPTSHPPPWPLTSLVMSYMSPSSAFI